MKIKGIKTKDLNVKLFIKQQIDEITSTVGNNPIINALSGGVDSSTVTMLAHKALGNQLQSYFIENGIMRKDEAKKVVSIFKKLGVPVKIIHAEKKFFNTLKNITDPEEKREAVTQTFYKDVFAKLIKKSKAKHLLQGTILTDVDETLAGIKRQHNVFAQLGIDPQKAFGYKIIEPLVQLRKDGVRKVAKSLGLPKEIYNRPPFPGPALAARIIGKVTPQRVKIVREATSIIEKILSKSKAFQYMAILHADKVTGMKNKKRNFGLQIEVRCWDSIDARTASPTKLSYKILDKLAEKLTKQIPDVVSVTYNITKKPPSTIEVV